MDLVMALEVLNYIPQKICTSLFYWTKQVEENGMFNGDETKERWIRRIY